MIKTDDRVGVVTGGGSGIGRAVALRLASDTMRVVVADINLEAAEATVRLIRENGGDAMAVRTDVTVDSDCRSLVQQVLSQYQRLDVAFNNAGIAGYPVLTADHTPDQWQRVISVNLTGVFNCMRHQIVAIKDSGGGSIVNTASIMGLKGAVGGGAYCASKHGVIGLTKSAALEYGRDGIRINAICPGYVDTPMTTGEDAIFSEKILQDGLRRAGIRRLATPDEIAETVVWLCSPSASYVTGGAYPVDGGVMAG